MPMYVLEINSYIKNLRNVTKNQQSIKTCEQKETIKQINNQEVMEKLTMCINQWD